MIDITSEEVILLREASELLPKRQGKKVHVATLYRWAKDGIRGVKLESLKVGGQACTSVEAVTRFVENTNNVPRGALQSKAICEKRRVQTMKVIEEAGL